MLSVDDICRCWLIVSGFYPDNHRVERVTDLLNFAWERTICQGKHGQLGLSAIS